MPYNRCTWTVHYRWTMEGGEVGVVRGSWGRWGGVGGVERRSCAFYHAEHIIEYRTIRGMKLPHFFYQEMWLLFYAACLLFEGGGVYRIAGNFRGRKLLRFLRFCGYLQKFSPRNLRAWRPLARQKWQSAKVFLRKNFIFHQFTKVFSLESFPLYGIPSDINSSWIRYVKATQDDCWMLSVVC